MPLQWRHQFWQSLEEDAGKRCSECVRAHVKGTVRWKVWQDGGGGGGGGDGGGIVGAGGGWR